MRTDTELRVDGMRILSDTLGMVESERFIMLMLREPFDYTEWRRTLFEGVALDKLLDDAMEYRNSMSRGK